MPIQPDRQRRWLPAVVAVFVLVAAAGATPRPTTELAPVPAIECMPEPVERVSEPAPEPAHHQVGIASYYAGAFHGNRTASGERYDMADMTAAHRTLPFGTRARVTDLASGKAVMVRINDRGPFRKGRIVDLSYAAAQKLGVAQRGLARVRLEVF